MVKLQKITKPGILLPARWRPQRIYRFSNAPRQIGGPLAVDMYPFGSLFRQPDLRNGGRVPVLQASDIAHDIIRRGRMELDLGPEVYRDPAFVQTIFERNKERPGNHAISACL
jgi:hypothetical protein